MSRKRVATILDVTSYIRTVMGFIFSNSVSLDPSMQIVKGCDLILLRRSLISMGASASLSIQVAFVEAEWCFKAIYESGKTFLIVGDKQS